MSIINFTFLIKKIFMKIRNIYFIELNFRIIANFQNLADTN